MKIQKGRCELCGREEVKLTVHHLIPKDEGGTFNETAMLCRPCHSQVHNLYTNKELALRLNTINDLKKDKEVSKFLKFIRKQHPQASVKIKKSNVRKSRR